MEILTFGIWVTAFVFAIQIHSDELLQDCDYTFDHDEHGNVTLMPDCDDQSLRCTAGFLFTLFWALLGALWCFG